jgi:hypothetical protein
MAATLRSSPRSLNQPSALIVIQVHGLAIRAHQHIARDTAICEALDMSPQREQIQFILIGKKRRQRWIRSTWQSSGQGTPPV